MNRLGLSTGTIVAIRKTDEPRDGDVVVARIDDSVMLKRFVRKGERHIELHPESTEPEHQPIRIDLATDDFHVDGVAVGALIGRGFNPMDGGDEQSDTASDRDLLAWVQRETARRNREENPERATQLRPLEDFSDEYADPTKYKTVDQERVGRRSAMIKGLIISECCGWPQPPTSEEVYEAMRAGKPTGRQQSMIDMVLRADFETLFGGWMEAAFTWRQVARAMEGRPWLDPKQIHAINTTASD